MNKLKKSGFTLAEVLIVVSIIGIVAQMIIPNLVENIQESQFKAAAKEAFSKCAQAIQQMKMDEGGSLASYIGNASAFKPVFMQYFKVIKNCNNSGCVPSAKGTLDDFSTIYTSLAGDAGETDFMDEGQFITNDGMFFGIQNSNNPLIPNNLFLTVDVNGYTQKPNVYGKDVFMFQVVNDNLLPVGANGTKFLSSSYCRKSISSPLQGLGCMSLVMQGIDY